MKDNQMLPDKYLTEGQVQLVTYKKENSTATERIIVPITIPSHNVKGFDLTDFTADQLKTFQELYAEYRQFFSQRMSLIPSFENWLDHTGNDKKIPEDVSRLYRTFKEDGLSKPTGM